MSEFNLQATSVDGLRRLMAIDGSASDEWGPDELVAVWACALEIHVNKLLEPQVDASRTSATGPTVRDVLHHGADLAVLAKLKRDAKDLMGATAAPIPGPIASVLYHGAVARALLGHGQRISSIDDAQLVEGLRWGTQQPWLDGTTRDVMRRLADDVFRRIGGGNG